MFKFKKWLPVPDASRHLSIMFGEEISKADVLRFALDGHLKLSVNFVNHTYGKCGKLIHYTDDENLPPRYVSIRDSLPEGKIDEFIQGMMEFLMFGDHILNLGNKVTSIKGIWDLSMVGGEQLDIEHEYQMLTGGPEVTLTCLEGSYVQKENGVICELQEMFDKKFIDRLQSEKSNKDSLEYYAKTLKKKFLNNEIDEKEADKLLEQRKENLSRPRDYNDNFYPAGGLPDDSVLVVRTQALIDFQEKLSRPEAGEKRPLDPRQEKTYLNIIGALLETVTGTFKEKSFSSETELREFIAEKFDDLRGVSTRTLADKFALAKKALNGELD